VFLNLLNNAMDAIGQHGTIDIRTEKAPDGKLVIHIADSGPGIKAEDIKHIFDPFFTTKDPGKGTGLGLYISYDIIRKLGGSITVNNSKSGGAVFTMVLPVISSGSSR
jgi:two-component system NtrC family sensor kinase